MSTLDFKSTLHGLPERTVPRRYSRRLPSARVIALSLVAAMVIVFVLISLWWQNTDEALPVGDYGKHLLIAFGFYNLIVHGYVGAPFKEFTGYPPLTHLVGAYYSLIAGGPTIIRMVMSENIVFVPLLAFGSYWTAAQAFNRTAGVLAALFALTTPMIISLFHTFMTDGPTTAMVAITVAAMLATDRFAKTRMSLLAGALAGVGAYTRSTFVLFIAGLFVVMMLRGGWHNRKGLGLFLLGAVVIAGPWYGLHFHDLFSETGGAVTSKQPLWYANYPYPTKTQLLKYTWYGWALVNQQLYLPLTLFFLAGLVMLSVAWLRNRSRDSLVPELVAGGFIGYLGTSLLTLEDPRYTIPALVYIAALATGWVVSIRWRPVRFVMIALLVLVALFNTDQINRGKPGYHTTIVLPEGRPAGAPNPIGEGTLTVAGTAGYFASQPARSPERPVLLSFLKRIKDDGATSVAFDAVSLNNGGYNLDSLSLLAVIAGLNVAGYAADTVTSPQVWWIFRTTSAAMHHKYCIPSPAINDTTGFFTVPGPLGPTARLRCP
jgi:hypothetical protein